LTSDQVLSVIIPAFNAETTIGAAVSSDQESGAAEVVVVDDGSADRTAHVAESYGARVLIQENRGASHARAAGLSHSRGGLVVFLDADDQLIPRGVDHSVSLLRRDSRTVTAGGATVGVWPGGGEQILPVKYEDHSAESMLRRGFGPWPPGAAVVRREALASAERMLPKPLNTRFAEDYELFVRLALTGSIVRHQIPSIRYHVFEGKSSRDPRSVLECKERIRRYYAAWLGMPDRGMSHRALQCQALLQQARHAQAFARGPEAAAKLAMAAAVHPMYLSVRAWQFMRLRGVRGLGRPDGHPGESLQR
jgi:glycosyltransferase involved in cell wall biosynthesis